MESEQNENVFQRGYDGSVAHVRRHPRRTAIIVSATILLILGIFIPVDPPHVSLSGQPILQGGPDWLTNTVITTIIVDILILLMAVVATTRMKVVPGRWQNLMEAVLEYLYSLAEGVAGRDARKYFPWVATIFIFVIISNWIGLIPGVGSIGFYHDEEHAAESEHARLLDGQLAMADGQLILVEPAAHDASLATAEGEEGEAENGGHGEFVPLFRPPSADLNVTFALAITTMVMVQVFGVQALGGSYFRKFFNASGEGFMRGISVFVGILELISEFSRVIAFGFRLFGNIFAGEIVLATMAFLIAFLLPVPFYMLELFVGFVQALVFMMLALVFFNMSTISHGQDHEH